MSADLLAEFGQGSGPAQSQPTRPQAHSLIDDLEPTDDEFFDSTAAAFQDKPKSFNLIAPQSQHTTPASQQPPRFDVFDLPRPHDSDVLFDAAVDTPASETEDEWGEFEGPEAPSQPSQPAHLTPAVQAAKAPTPRFQPYQNTQISATVDLLDSLSVEDSVSSTKELPNSALKSNQHPQEGKPPPASVWEDDSFGDWGEFADGPSVQPPPTKSPPKPNQFAPKPTPAQPTWDDDAFDDWGDFTDGPRAPSAPSPAEPKPASKPSKATPNPAPRSFTSGTPAPASKVVRPTNIPPPSVLLELLIDIFNNLQQEATKVKARDTAASARETTALRINNTLETAARIIAGRTLRWKRDTILSQSMRIGPATGKVGGMKLSAVNKHEDVKEEQDAVDVLTLWRERAALFNTVIQAAGQRSIPAVPDAGALKVVTARADQGALKASHACALCALKRDERVLRIDEVDVQDSFGEWWTEHWGHAGCQRFWEANRHLLGQR
ncbi:uncharacterized protein N7459_008791 [Penicillium hispanicum]|uniref:uncharacterized protein n=1 Tax=Penicillium hispanicum TaxID=1080232 RepID=UPI0025421D45|nr:uncharacterized protein N7459_008791 [Penicillium hispanicum]KAJ5574364.1 hypothetical protein N7459_008791 [Penicillium hispanicum]